jgi:hypothetical protein
MKERYENDIYCRKKCVLSGCRIFAAVCLENLGDKQQNTYYRAVPELPPVGLYKPFAEYHRKQYTTDRKSDPEHIKRRHHFKGRFDEYKTESPVDGDKYQAQAGDQFVFSALFHENEYKKTSCKLQEV